MKAIIATGYGGPEVLQLAEVTKPQPQQEEVLVKVYATSATKADTMILTGKPYFGRLMTGIRRPKNPIPGAGFAGEIVAIGETVTQFKVGDRVFGNTTVGFSTNAEYVAVPANGVILPIPEGMSYAEATVFCDGPVTSLNFLKEVAQVQPGQHVLINGASGSLGTAAVQLAKHLGAKVTGVCSGRNVGLVRSLGADTVIDYTQKDFTRGNVQYDVIYDTVGKSSFSACKSILKSNGQYVSPVLQFKLIGQMILTSLQGSKKAKFAATGLRSDDELRTLFTELVEIYQEGKIKVVIDRQYPLEKVAEAHTYIAGGHKKGNVVITVGA